ncbi:MAG: cupin domain-containing protein [Saprospiraceae bacterium]|nr:cupin domain-containing protein [Saprospiraceae bacterium]
MKTTFPHTITNCLGEKIIFQALEQPGDKLIVESFCEPGFGPPMHTHLKQDECLTVVSGRMAYQIQGEETKYAGPGETVMFERGVAHKFWVVSDVPLHCKGFIQPANTFVFYIGAIFEAQNKSGKAQPEMFDGAYLMTRYASEYEMNEIPAFVKKTVLPMTYRVGKLLGKYKHFEGAPEPV